MVFSSLEFIFQFLPIFLLIYFLCPARYKNFCLFAGSMLFYLYGVWDTPLYLALFGASMAVNYFFGCRIARSRARFRRRKRLFWGVAYNLFWLLLFKYTGFFTENINGILRLMGLSLELPVFAPVLPVGISFYTFQAISYLADVYRKTAEYEPSFVNFAMYISMFPQLIAGPIVTYSSIKKEISRRSHSMRAVEEGLKTFTIGLGLKVLLANRLGGLWNEAGTVGYESISTPFAWLAITAFSLQIYFDFYGYSLMAKGLGRIMGFTIPENFHDPYLSLSMTEFWRRWHMTLGSWFRDYVYIPLGGQQEGKAYDLPQYAGGLGPHRILAWGKLELYPLGASDVCADLGGKAGAHTDFGEGPGPGPSLHGLCHFRKLGAVCGDGSFADGRLLYQAVPVPAAARGNGIFCRRLFKIWKALRALPGSGTGLCHWPSHEALQAVQK